MESDITVEDTRIAEALTREIFIYAAIFFFLSKFYAKSGKID